ncbi:MAG TPA: glycosyltransferase [Verrucomicrobiae bacterium]|nr:glycosyltransferase [Verrucomicrobiae bacterium]
MKVSVLVPVFNGKQHLAECLESILTQDFQDLEILVGDDGSTDGSQEIAKTFAIRDRRVRCWQNPHNLGLTENSNACLGAASGEYIKFVHQDDKLLSGSAISKMVTALDEHPAASLVGCRQHLTGTAKTPTAFFNHSGCYDGRRVVVACLERNTNLIGQPTLTLFRRLQAQRGFDRRFTGMMDFEMWCHLLEQGDFVYLDEALATWRVHDAHQTARAQAGGLANDEQLRFMEIYHLKPWLRELATDRMWFTQVYYLRKNYGAKADALASAMLAHLSRRRYAWQWLKHRISRPAQKLSRKLRQ